MRRFEDICNSTPNGNGLHYTSSVTTMEEELLAIEQGPRVANVVMTWAIDRWDALSDRRLEAALELGG